MPAPTTSGQCPEVGNAGHADISHYVYDLYQRVCTAEAAATTAAAAATALAARVTALEGP